MDLVATEQSIDTTAPAGRLLFAMLGAIAEFERDLIRERVVAGIRRAKAQGADSGGPKAPRGCGQGARDTGRGLLAAGGRPCARRSPYSGDPRSGNRLTDG